MGTRITKNDKGYRLKSTVSGKRMHEAKRISENEAKKLLMEGALWDFLGEVVKIDHFPDGYMINGKFEGGRRAEGLKWLIDNAYGDDGWDVLNARVEKALQRVGAEFKIEMLDSVVEVER